MFWLAGVVRVVVRFQGLEIGGQGEARPIKVHGAAVGNDLALVQSLIPLSYSTGFGLFFSNEMPTIAAWRIFHAIAATSESGRSG